MAEEDTSEYWANKASQAGAIAKKIEKQKPELYKAWALASTVNNGEDEEKAQQAIKDAEKIQDDANDLFEVYKSRELACLVDEKLASANENVTNAKNELKQLDSDAEDSDDEDSDNEDQ